MKNYIKAGSALAGWLLITSAVGPGKNPSIQQKVGDQLPGFAVVELFTSEGCSSCPPADKLAHELANDARQHNRPVYVLSFHVDYWNRLGWKDPFSTHAATERQYWYAGLLKKGNVYTPQMVVNGTAEFVGSRKAEAQQRVETALYASSTVPLSLSQAAVESSKAVKVSYAFPETAEKTILHCALVEKGLSSEVKAGENKGKKLFHENVVRSFQSVKNPAGKGTLTIAHTGSTEQFEIIAYLQNAQTGKILGANKINF